MIDTHVAYQQQQQQQGQQEQEEHGTMPAAAREPLLSGPGDTSPSPEQQHPDTFWPCVANLSKVIIGAGGCTARLAWL